MGGDQQCMNTKPSVCPIENLGGSSSEDSGDKSGESPGESPTGDISGEGRRKRSPGGGEKETEEDSLSKVDFEANARFVGMMMSVEEDTRIALGHSFGPQFSAIENATRLGFIYQCVYRGSDCNNER